MSAADTKPGRPGHQEGDEAELWAARSSRPGGGQRSLEPAAGMGEHTGGREGRLSEAEAEPGLHQGPGQRWGPVYTARGCRWEDLFNSEKDHKLGSGASDECFKPLTKRKKGSESRPEPPGRPVWGGPPGCVSVQLRGQAKSGTGPSPRTVHPERGPLRVPCSRGEKAGSGGQEEGDPRD